jgi:hypothetical protein
MESGTRKSARSADKSRRGIRAHRPAAECVAPPRARDKGRAISFANEALSRLATILAQSGISPAHLLREFRAICAQLPTPSRCLNFDDIEFVTDLPHVLAYWHSDIDYLDQFGNPRALLFDGERASLSTLIARVYAERDAKEVLQKLISTGAIRQTGDRFEPTGREIIFRSASLGRLHALTPLMGFLKTVEHNLTHPRRQALLELTANNPRIPRAALRELRDHVNERGTELLFEVDAAMHRLEAGSRDSDSTMRVGTCVFIYTNDQDEKVGRRKKRVVPS